MSHAKTPRRKAKEQKCRVRTAHQLAPAMDSEDAADLAAFAERAHEPNLPFEEVFKDLRQRGKI